MSRSERPLDVEVCTRNSCGQCLHVAYLVYTGYSADEVTQQRLGRAVGQYVAQLHFHCRVHLERIQIVEALNQCGCLVEALPERVRQVVRWIRRDEEDGLAVLGKRNG